MGLLKKSQFAALHGWSPSYISVLLKKGTIQQTPDGKIDNEPALLAIRAAANPKQAHVAQRHARDRAANAAAIGAEPPVPTSNTLISVQSIPEGASGTFHAARTQREGYEAQLAGLKYQQAIGGLVEAEQVRREQYELYKRVAAGLDQLPDRLAPMIAAETDAFVIREMIEVEIARIRDELADTFTDEAERATTH